MTTKEEKNHHIQSEYEDMNEYWIEGGSCCFQETKKDFYKSIGAGFRGFILYPSGKTFWITNNSALPKHG